MISNTATLVLVPFFVAFLVFTGRFYGRESAASKTNPSFLLALGTMLIAIAYLALSILNSLPEYSTAAFGAVGLCLLALSIYRLFLI